MSTDLDTSEGLVRIRVPLDPAPEAGGPADDWLWAEPLGAGRYRIESSPFFAYGISPGDVVRANETAPGEPPELAELERKGGWRSLRIALGETWDLGSPEVMRFLDGLMEMGCTYEGLPPKLVALAIPPELDVAPVLERLQGPYRDGLLLWEWVDPRPS